MGKMFNECVGQNEGWAYQMYMWHMPIHFFFFFFFFYLLIFQEALNQKHTKQEKAVTIDIIQLKGL